MNPRRARPDPHARCLDRAGRVLAARESGRALVVAASGGADSTALALVVAALRRRGRLRAPRVVLAYCDHGQHARSAEAAAAVAALAERLDFAFAPSRLDLPPDAGEASMRAARYSALSACARAHDSDLVATAHHRDDQVETVVMRALRGTGPRGLAGIPEWRPLAPGIALVRPLLRARRSDLHAVVRAAGIDVVEDPTNADVRRTRAAVRHVILPALRRTGPADDTVVAVARRARSRAARVEADARRWIGEHAVGRAAWRADLPFPQDVAPEVREEVLRLLHVALWGSAPLRSWLRRVLALEPAPAGARVDAGLFAERTRHGLLLVDRRLASAPPGEPVPVATDARVVPFGSTEWSIRAGPCGPDAPLSDARRARAVFDRARVALPLTARAARSGDVLDMAGRRRPVPLRDAMKRRHVPRFDRDRIPVVVDANGRCLWAPGLDVAAFARVGPSTSERNFVATPPRTPGGIPLPEPSY